MHTVVLKSEHELTDVQWFCPHKVCYGFSLMREHESPRHLFNIFKTRFSHAPKRIIYDNACKLYQYCLNREPEFFNPLTAQTEIKGQTPCAELLVFFLFFSNGDIILNVKYCCNVFCLLSTWFLCKTDSKQKKVRRKIFTRTNFTQIFPHIVPWHTRVCQQSTEGGGNFLTYTGMSTEQSRG